MVSVSGQLLVVQPSYCQAEKKINGERGFPLAVLVFLCYTGYSLKRPGPLSLCRVFAAVQTTMLDAQELTPLLQLLNVSFFFMMCFSSARDECTLCGGGSNFTQRLGYRTSNSVPLGTQYSSNSTGKR